MLAEMATAQRELPPASTESTEEADLPLPGTQVAAVAAALATDSRQLVAAVIPIGLARELHEGLVECEAVEVAGGILEVRRA